MTHGHEEGCPPKDFFQAARVGRKMWKSACKFPSQLAEEFWELKPKVEVFKKRLDCHLSEMVRHRTALCQKRDDLRGWWFLRALDSVGSIPGLVVFYSACVSSVFKQLEIRPCWNNSRSEKHLRSCHLEKKTFAGEVQPESQGGGDSGPMVSHIGTMGVVVPWLQRRPSRTLAGHLGAGGPARSWPLNSLPEPPPSSCGGIEDTEDGAGTWRWFWTFSCPSLVEEAGTLEKSTPSLSSCFFRRSGRREGGKIEKEGRKGKGREGRKENKRKGGRKEKGREGRKENRRKEGRKEGRRKGGKRGRKIEKEGRKEGEGRERSKENRRKEGK
ncbi:High mobility group nucleosome-binding domain-containing protein 5, partial [Ophiophagus hannah]